MSRLTPLSQLRISRYQIPAHGLIPNTSIQKYPLTIYHGAFLSATPTQIESHLKSMGVVVPAWRYTMYSFDHFHSTSHEVLCVYSGKARLCFGGQLNPNRIELEAEKGDVMLLPAGVSHRLLEELEPPFQMIGSYPRGLHFDMCYGKPGEESKIEGIRRLDWFDKDPVYGDHKAAHGST